MFHYFNPFVPNASFLYPLKTSENLENYLANRTPVGKLKFAKLKFLFKVRGNEIS